jgi:hypothetical protein
MHAFDPLSVIAERSFLTIAFSHGVHVEVTRLPPDIGAPHIVAIADQQAQEQHAAGSAAAVHQRLEDRDLERDADRLVLSRYAPAGVIVDQDMDILQFRGHTGRFLTPPPGAATLNLLRMARPGLALDLRTIIHEARKDHKVAHLS